MEYPNIEEWRMLNERDQAPDFTAKDCMNRAPVLPLSLSKLEWFASHVLKWFGLAGFDTGNLG